MADGEKAADREARHGEKMIEVKIRFWTDGLASESGKILPKHAWAAGVVRMESNRSHTGYPPRILSRSTPCWMSEQRLSRCSWIMGSSCTVARA